MRWTQEVPIYALLLDDTSDGNSAGCFFGALASHRGGGAGEGAHGLTRPRGPWSPWRWQRGFASGTLQRGRWAWETPAVEGTTCPASLHSTGGTGGWSAKGCELLSRNRTHVACQCGHTGSFAVLMDVSRREVGAAPGGTPAAPQVYRGH